jgi:hypothetical protein
MSKLRKNIVAKPIEKQQRPRVRRRFIILAIATVLLLLLILVATDDRLTVRRYTVATDKINGTIRVVMVSDLHSATFGEDQGELVRAIKKEEPDVVVFVGDMCDNWENRALAEDVFRAITPLYPCYYVTGNHEYWTGRSAEIVALFERYELTVLQGESDILSVNGQTTRICGITDADAPRYTGTGHTTEARSRGYSIRRSSWWWKLKGRKHRHNTIIARKRYARCIRLHSKLKKYWKCAHICKKWFDALFFDPYN